MRYSTATVAVLLLLCACRENKSTPPPAIHVPRNTESAALAEANTLLQQATRDEMPLQKFTVAHTRTATITGRKGLRVTVDPLKLCHADGSPVMAAVEVEIKELASAMDMLFANAPTVSNGRMLESGGAYYVGMKSAGETLMLKSGSRLTVQLPQLSKKNMQLFYGQKNETGMVNWQPDTARFTPQAVSVVKKQRVMRFISRTKEVKVKDSIASRPATLGECMSIYIDSFKKARYAYGIANRHRLSHRQEMSIYLQPVEFPFARFTRGIVKPRWGNESYKNSLSNMYRVPDTIPVYKQVPLKPVKEGEQVEVESAGDLPYYYAPAEVDRLGWINCDRFLDIPISRNIQLQLPGNMKMDACKVYYVFKNINSVMQEQFIKPASNTMKVYSELPENTAVTLIVVGVRNKKMYVSHSSGVIRSNAIIQVPLRPMKAASLAAELRT